MWYGVSILMRGIKKHARASDTDTWEESIRLIEADSEESAWKTAEEIGRAAEHSYQTALGNHLQWEFDGVLGVLLIDEDPLISGVEVFARFLKGAAVSKLRRPID